MVNGGSRDAGNGMADIRMLRYGSPEPLPERRALRAGPLTAVLENGGLRYIRIGGREIVRGIYAAVRDRNWGTILPVFRRFEVAEQGDSFEVAFTAEHRQGDIDFEWEGRITGSGDGTISFSFDGTARSTFLRNRIGFCVLHPAELAGCAAEVETPDGKTSGSFPERISPHQPFMNMKAISHEVRPGLKAELRFEGDLFEMEDQRNWTDASYKTYCTPLGLPFPVEIRAGQRVRQSVTLRLHGDVPAAGRAAAGAADSAVLTETNGQGDSAPSSETDRVGQANAGADPAGDGRSSRPGENPERSPGRAAADAVDQADVGRAAGRANEPGRSLGQAKPGSGLPPMRIEVGERPAGRVPQLGLGLAPGRLPGPEELAALRALRLSFLRATLRLAEPQWELELERAAAAARALGAGLELETVGGEHDGRLEALVRAIAEGRLPVEAVFAFPAAGYDGTESLLVKLIALRDDAGLAFRAGSGTRANFAEFNRAELPIRRLEAAMYAINPQVHAFDAASLTEAASAQADTARSARAIVGGLPLSVGPVTLKQRLNPVATSEEAARQAENRANHIDPRQYSLFGAGWTLGSLRSLTEAAPERVCYFETSGPLGVMTEGEAAPYPLYHVLAAAGPLQGGEALACRVEDRLVCDALAVRRDGGMTLLLANTADETRRIRVNAPAFRPDRLRMLDERGARRTADGDGFLPPQLADLPVPPVRDGAFELELPPFAFAVADGREVR